MPSEFKNEPFTDFSQPENVQAMEDALAKVLSELGKEYDLIVGGRRNKTTERITSVDPSDPSRVIGSVSKASRDVAEEAIKAATDAFATWKNVKPEDRAEYLFKAAAKVRERKFEFSAWLVYEVGKSWRPARNQFE